MVHQLPTLRRGDPPTLTALQRQLNRVFDDFFDDFFGRPFAPEGDDVGPLALRAPIVDMTETDEEIRVEAELPGVDEKDLEITITEDKLTIRGEKRAEQSGEDKGRRWSERAFGSFERVLRLAAPVQSDQAKATFKNGVLEIRVPKSAEEKERVRKIPIGGG